ncbi:ornithine aminomutase subunit alpha [Halarsenatibacter silvermanii]|uniref:D-ornithine 4,5-aminomutase S subunit n=1 Tax=Halarsenatibacter silvermanii TaxID=321763 RepID=A0A1G9QS24_9FIRM|nr:ornithine aminomutase subunit alpha [Halarsenatibacter silvermanii]SDM13784.1 D-ornithine 4,5-aminomutase S subunit [Halarsenatibacter silvermanii]
MPERRDDNFAERREHMSDMSEEELREKFWNLSEEIVDPIIELARSHTSPSIERSVLLRMGFDSQEAKAIVKKVMEAELLGKGAGHVVLKISEKDNISIREAGLRIKNGRLEVREMQSLFTEEGGGG